MGMQQGFIEVEINGEIKQMRYDFNAMADLEEYFGKGLATVMDEERIGFSTIRALYWAGLKWRIKGLTMERTGNMIYKEMQAGKELKDLMEPVAKALKVSGFMRSAGDEQEDDEQEDDEPKN